MMLAYQPIRSLATLNLAVYQGSTAFKRISTIIDKEIKIRENENFPEINIKDSNIFFKNVSFQYDKTDKKTIKDINFNIDGGSMTALLDIVERVKALF